MAELNEILDLETLGALKALQRPGAPSVLDRVIAAMMRSALGLLAQIRDGIARGDLETVGAAAHSLKSGSANAGAKALSAVARDLEAAARAGDAVESARLAAELDRMWPMVAAAYEAFQHDLPMAKSA